MSEKKFADLTVSDNTPDGTYTVLNTTVVGGERIFVLTKGHVVVQKATTEQDAATDYGDLGSIFVADGTVAEVVKKTKTANAGRCQCPLGRDERVFS